MKFSLGASLLLLLVLCTASFSAVPDDFAATWENTNDRQERIQLATDAMARVTDIDAQRAIQDRWRDWDRESAFEYFTARMAADPSAANVYLHGRMLEDMDAIRAARRVIELDPSFAHGYRLLIVPYYKVLFRNDTDHPAWDEMTASVDGDLALVLRNRDVLEADVGGLSLLYEVDVFRQDHDATLKTLHAARALGAEWANGERIARVHARRGDFAKARDAVQMFLDDAIEAGELDHNERREEFLDRYVGVLQDVGAAEEGVRFLSRVQDEGLLPKAQYYLAQAYMGLDDPSGAITALQTMANLGWDRTYKIEQNEVFAGLHERAEWMPIVTQVRENRAVTADARRAEALAGRMNKPAPELPLITSTGETTSLADLRGKVVVIDFWATWCGPCRAAMPLIHAFTEGVGDDVVVISLNVWENAPDKARAYIADNEYAMELMWPSDDVDAPALFEVRGIPTLVVIDQEGVIRFREVGFEEGLDEKLAWFAEDLLAVNE